MKIFTTYRFIATFLSFSILIGVSVPSIVHSMPIEECDLMEKDHDIYQSEPHEEDCPNVDMRVQQCQSNENNGHLNMYNIGFACACAIDEASVKTEAQLQLKIKVSVLHVIKILEEIHIDETETHTFLISVSDTYSPPPIYLANESFLN